MNRKVIGLSLGFLLLAVLGLRVYASWNKDAGAYGTSIDTSRGLEVSLEAVFSDPDAYRGKNIIVEGKVGQVCQTSGCWVILTDGPYQIYVQFYTFTIESPAGSFLRVQGELLFQNQVPYLAAEGLEILKD